MFAFTISNELLAINDEPSAKLKQLRVKAFNQFVQFVAAFF